MEVKVFKVEQLAGQVAAQGLQAVRVVPRGYADLTDQFRRSVTSVALNTAEGCQRKGADRQQILRVALGSAREASMALRLLVAVDAVAAAQASDIEAGLDEVRAMLWVLANR